MGDRARSSHNYDIPKNGIEEVKMRRKAKKQASSMQKTDAPKQYPVRLARLQLETLSRDGSHNNIQIIA